MCKDFEQILLRQQQTTGVSNKPSPSFHKPSQGQTSQDKPPKKMRKQAL
jgi:hypothetical protein